MPELSRMLPLLVPFILFGCVTGGIDSTSQSGVSFEVSKDKGLFGGRRERTAGIAVADFDGDLDNDIIVINGRHWEEDNYVLFNDGSGREFQREKASAEPHTGYGVCTGDFDSDGDLDAVVARDGPPPALYVNDGAGAFSQIEDIGRSTYSRDCFVIDIDGDAHLDAIFSERGGQTYALLGPLNEDPASLDLMEGPVVGVAAGDVDGNGLVDIVLSLRGPATFALVRQVADREFEDPIIFGPPDEQSRALTVADLDGDGSAEIVVAVVSGTSKVISLEDGALNVDMEFTEITRATAVAMADLNQDGKADIVFGTPRRNVAVIASDTGFETVTLPGLRADTYDVAIGDLNGDQWPDIVFANSRSKNEILLSKDH